MDSATHRTGGVHSRSLTLALGLLIVLRLTSACQTSCAPGNQAAIPYVDGKIHVTGGDRIYETTPRDGEWLHYPSNRRFLFKHNLGTSDYQIDARIAFGSHPVPEDQDASADTAIADTAIASGDMYAMIPAPTNIST